MWFSFQERSLKNPDSAVQSWHAVFMEQGQAEKISMILYNILQRKGAGKTGPFPVITALNGIRLGKSLLSRNQF